jgi:hypothetical protein
MIAVYGERKDSEGKTQEMQVFDQGSLEI